MELGRPTEALHVEFSSLDEGRSLYEYVTIREKLARERPFVIFCAKTV